MGWRATPLKNRQSVRIGGASGYWGDSADAARQLVMQGDVDYLVFDYLAEVTMSILARARTRDPNAGYATDFIELVMRPLLADIVERRIRVVANCGGMNVTACAQALQTLAREGGVALKIGVVEGDDLTPQLDNLRQAGTRDMFNDNPLPDNMISANAYLGAFPIAAALDAGADVVITGRCVDSAVTLGPLIHEFGWRVDDFDLLAAGTLAGHIIECGAQATGGNFTDWRDVADDWHDMGYPIAECRRDGRFAITKPAGTGGLVSPLSVGEQILYEIGDPAAYIMPDVVCDFSQASLHQDGVGRVQVNGVRGHPPTKTFKVSATYLDGYRACAQFAITGFEAVAKAETTADALVRRTRQQFAEQNLPDYHSTASHVIGAETLWGHNAGSNAHLAREVVLQIEVRHPDRAALEIFSKESTGTGLAMATGRCAVGEAGRPRITPVVAQSAFLIDKSEVTIRVSIDGQDANYTPPAVDYAPPPASQPLIDATPSGERSPTTVPLIALAVARSGDKGDNANIGVMARDPDCYQVIRRELTSAGVAHWFRHVTLGDVDRFDVPGFGALNFVLNRSLGGGGTSSLHLDKQAKTYAQVLLAMPIAVPATLAQRLYNRSDTTLPEAET